MRANWLSEYFSGFSLRLLLFIFLYCLAHRFGSVFPACLHWHKCFAEPGNRRGNEDSCGNENQKSRKLYFPWKKINKHTFFFMEIKMDLWMQMEGIKLIFVMNCSVLLFFKFASRMPQITQILVSTFKIFLGGGGGGGEDAPGSPRNFLSIFR